VCSGFFAVRFIETANQVLKDISAVYGTNLIGTEIAFRSIEFFYYKVECVAFYHSLDNVIKIKLSKNIKHVLIVGYSRAAEGYIDRIKANPQWGYYVYGILDDSMEIDTMVGVGTTITMYVYL